MPGVEEVLRTIAFALVRFSVFTANALVFGLVPIILWVVRPAFATISEEGWDEGRRLVSERLEGMVRAALIASAVATGIGLVLQAVLVSSLGGGDLDASAFDAVFGTTFGQWYLIRLPLLVATAILVVGTLRRQAMRSGVGAWWWAWGLIALALLSTSSFSGHAAVAQPRALALANDILHLAAGAVWFTGIVVLAVVLPDGWKGKGDLARLRLLAPAVIRFSTVALVTIAILLATGTLNSFLHIGSPGDMVDTGYGQSLVIKLALFVGILMIGGINHLVLRERMERGLRTSTITGAQYLFRKTIALELAIGISIMAVTGALTGLARTRGL